MSPIIIQHSNSLWYFLAAVCKVKGTCQYSVFEDSLCFWKFFRLLNESISNSTLPIPTHHLTSSDPYQSSGNIPQPNPCHVQHNNTELIIFFLKKNKECTMRRSIARKQERIWNGSITYRTFELVLSVFPFQTEQPVELMILSHRQVWKTGSDQTRVTGT